MLANRWGLGASEGGGSKKEIKAEIKACVDLLHRARGFEGWFFGRSVRTFIPSDYCESATSSVQYSVP